MPIIATKIGGIFLAEQIDGDRMETEREETLLSRCSPVSHYYLMT